MNPRRHTPPGLRILVAVLLALVMFWDTERVARTMGEAYAADIVAAPWKLPAVAVYSQDDLGIEGLGDDSSGTRPAPPYRYGGLRLLHRSGNRYLLITQNCDPANTRVFVVSETPTVRIEFLRDRRECGASSDGPVAGGSSGPVRWRGGGVGWGREGGGVHHDRVAAPALR